MRPESSIVLWIVATLVIWLSSTTARRLPMLAPVKVPKRRAPSCDSVKLHSQRPGESESVAGRALRMS